MLFQLKIDFIYRFKKFNHNGIGVEYTLFIIFMVLLQWSKESKSKDMGSQSIILIAYDVINNLFDANTLQEIITIVKESQYDDKRREKTKS